MIENFVRTVIWLAIVFAVIGAVDHCAHAAVVECSAKPGNGKVYWLWRYIDGKQCWFPAESGMKRGREKPANQLRWHEEEPERPPPSLLPPEEEKPPWMLEPRWFGGDVR